MRTLFIYLLLCGIIATALPALAQTPAIQGAVIDCYASIVIENDLHMSITADMLTGVQSGPATDSANVCISTSSRLVLYCPKIVPLYGPYGVIVTAQTSLLLNGTATGGSSGYTYWALCLPAGNFGIKKKDPCVTLTTAVDVPTIPMSTPAGEYIGTVTLTACFQ